MPRFLIVLLVIFSTSCCKDKLSVYTEIVDYTQLASFHVGTPDPRSINPPYGQRLHISWYIPGYNETTEVRAKLRFANLSEADWVIPIDSCRGHSTWNLLCEDYESTGGLITYKVELIQDDKIVEQSHHALWTELIVFDKD